MLPEYASAQMRDSSDGSNLDAGVTSFFRTPGGAYAATANAAVSRSNGEWEVQLNATERGNTQGFVQLRHASGLTQVVPLVDVDAYKADVSNLDVAVSTRSTLDAAGVWAHTTRELTSAAKITSDGSAITMTSPGVVDRVTLVDTTTANTDMLTAAAVWSNAGRTLTSAANITSDGSAILVSAGFVDRVTLVDTVTDVTNKTGFSLDTTQNFNNTGQTTPQPANTTYYAGVPVSYGDATPFGMQDVDTNVDTLLTRLTAARAGYLDNLNIGGLVASQADVQAITVASRVKVVPPPQMERPESGSTPFRIWIYSYDSQGVADDLDSNPVVAAENNAGADRSGNLGTVTKQPATTGVYYVDYTVASTHELEGLVFKVDATEGGVTTRYPASSSVSDSNIVGFTSADRTTLNNKSSQTSVDALPAATDAELSGNHGGGSWETANTTGLATEANATANKNEILTEGGPGPWTTGSGGGGLTEQQVRDAMKLSPSVGPPDAGSVDEHLDNIEGKTTNLPGDPASEATAAAAAKPGDQMDLVDAPNATAVSAIQNGLARESTSQGIKAKTDLIRDMYHADVDLTIDGDDSFDRYTVCWKKDDAAVTTAIADPKITVKNRDDTVLIAETAMTANGQILTYDTDTKRTTPGEAVTVDVTATIDGAPQFWTSTVSRDSEAPTP